MLRLVVPLLAAALALVAPAHADNLWLLYVQRQEECENTGNAYPLDVSIRGCSMIIRSNNVTGLARAAAYRKRADRYREAEDVDRAIADYTQAIRYDADMAVAYTRRAGLHMRRSAYQRAADDYTQAIRVLPDHPSGYAGRCRALLFSNGSPQAARADCDEALRLRPDYTYALNARGILNLREGRFDEAWADFDAHVSGYSGVADSLYGRGVAAVRLGREADGRADIAEATALAPDIAQTFASYGVTP
jgi:tetratricopeptide (TPR) repeat protein